MVYILNDRPNDSISFYFRQLNNIFGELDDFLMVNTLNFRPGSVIVPFTITYDSVDYSPLSEIENAFYTSFSPSPGDLYVLNGGDLHIADRNRKFDQIITSSFFNNLYDHYIHGYEVTAKQPSDGDAEKRH